MTASLSVSSYLYPQLSSATDSSEVIIGSESRQDGVSLLVLPFVSYLTTEAASSAREATNGTGSRGQARKLTGPKLSLEESQKREKNRLAAKQCRQKKKEQERRQKQTLRQLQDERSQLQQRVKKLSALYLSCLCHFQTKAAFYEYLKRNQELVRDPESKRLLLEFMESGFKSLV